MKRLSRTVELRFVDGRHRAYPDFKWYVEPQYTPGNFGHERISQYYNWCNWARELWGHSVPIHHWQRWHLVSDLGSPHWSYFETERGHDLKLYLRNDMEAEIFTLKWI